MDSLTAKDHGEGSVTLSLLDEVVATTRPDEKVPAQDRRRHRHALPTSPKQSTSALGPSGQRRFDNPRSPRAPKSPRLPPTLSAQPAPRKDLPEMPETSGSEIQTPVHVPKPRNASWTVVPPPDANSTADEPPTVVVVKRHSVPSTPPRSAPRTRIIHNTIDAMIKSLEGEVNRSRPAIPPKAAAPAIPPKPAALRTSGISPQSQQQQPESPPKPPKPTLAETKPGAEEELQHLRLQLSKQQAEIEELKLTQSLWRAAQDKGLFERTAEERREKSMELLAAEQKQTESMADTIERQMELIKRQGDIMAQQEEVINGLEQERDEFEDERDELEEERDELAAEVAELKKVNEGLVRQLEAARRLGGVVSVKSFG